MDRPRYAGLSRSAHGVTTGGAGLRGCEVTVQTGPGGVGKPHRCTLPAVPQAPSTACSRPRCLTAPRQPPTLLASSRCRGDVVGLTGFNQGRSDTFDAGRPQANGCRRRGICLGRDVVGGCGIRGEFGMGDSNPFFEKPILNSPYEYPLAHWELDKSPPVPVPSTPL